MNRWSAEDPITIGNVTEIDIASARPDGSLRPYVTIWGVRHGDNLYVRSAHGYDNPWFQRALTSGEGRIRAGGMECDVASEVPEPELAEGIIDAYQKKYDHYGASIVGTVVSPEAARSTLRLARADLPRPDQSQCGSPRLWIRRSSSPIDSCARLRA